MFLSACKIPADSSPSPFVADIPSLEDVFKSPPLVEVGGVIILPNRSVCTASGAVLNTLNSSPRTLLPKDLNSVQQKLLSTLLYSFPSPGNFLHEMLPVHL